MPPGERSAASPATSAGIAVANDGRWIFAAVDNGDHTQLRRLVSRPLRAPIRGPAHRPGQLDAHPADRPGAAL
jgi:hypothetical protein